MFYQIYRNQCICRLASVLTENCHTTNRQVEAETDSSQKYSAQFSFGDKDVCSFGQIEHRNVDRCYATGRIQSSVTKFRFEENTPVEICDEWYYTVHYLKTVVSSIEDSLHDFRTSSVEDVNGLSWFARPYHYTKDDVVDIRRLQSPDERIHLAVTDFDAAAHETYDRESQKCCEKSGFSVDIFADRLPSVFISNTQRIDLDKYLASTALATLCSIIPFHCSCQDLLRHGRPAELFPYLDAKTFYSCLLNGLGESSRRLHILHCDTASRPLVVDSATLLYLGNRPEPQLLSSGTSVDLTPGRNGDKQKMPNIDQLRAIQDNLAYNVCHVMAFT